MKLQCKHIPTQPILEFLLKNKGRWCSHYGGDNDVRAAMPAGIHKHLVLAKMENLIRRGLVDGCYCGCRGDFELTVEGEKHLELLKQYKTI